MIICQTLTPVQKSYPTWILSLVWANYCLNCSPIHFILFFMTQLFHFALQLLYLCFYLIQTLSIKEKQTNSKSNLIGI